MSTNTDNLGSQQGLPNPYPAGPRFIHNTQRKDVNHQPPAQPVALSGASPDVFFRKVTITTEARRIARILGMRSAEYLAQRVIDAETTVQELVARVLKLEKVVDAKFPAHLVAAKVERRA
jgi:hypothetical protein